jgi:Protein of unknown function C-terminus (DUF2399)
VADRLAETGRAINRHARRLAEAADRAGITRDGSPADTGADLPTSAKSRAATRRDDIREVREHLTLVRDAERDREGAETSLGKSRLLLGQPSTAFHKLAGIAVADGGELAYHGDFDWPGVAITTRVIDRHGGRPWRMTAGDYLAGVQASDSPVGLKGEPVPTPWEPGLYETMRTTGRAIYEETIADQLLADLSG